MTNQDNLRGYDLENLASAKIYSNINYDNFSIDYGVTTDGGASVFLQKDGKKVEVIPSTYYEYVGETCNDGEPAKIIYAYNGDIYLDAPNGDIIIRAKNVRIVAQDGSGEVTVQSGKIIDLRAPAIKENATNITVAAPGNLETMVGTKSGSAQIQNQDGSSTDLLQGSFLGGILSGLQNLKKFFNDCKVI
jgi:hypothetical protein